jgi:hypothetical protein
MKNRKSESIEKKILNPLGVVGGVGGGTVTCTEVFEEKNIVGCSVGLTKDRWRKWKVKSKESGIRIPVS